jgi:hypothetical protein
MAERHGSRPERRVRGWWLVAGVATVLLAAGVAAQVLSHRGSPVSERRATTSPTTRGSTVAPSTAAPTPASCGRSQARAAPAPSGGDDTQSLTAFFASTPNDSCVAFSAATYRLDGTLRISGKSALEIDGNGAVLAAQTPANRERRHVVIAKSSNVGIKDLNVRGANRQHLSSQWQLEAQHGFEVGDHSTDIRLVNVHVAEVFGDAIYIGGGSADVLVQGGEFSDTGRQGVAVSAARGVTLEGFTLRNAGRYCIDLEPNVPRLAVEQVTIRNTTSTCPKGWLIVHSDTVRGVYSDNNAYNGSSMPSGRLTPGIYPKRSP